MPTLSTFGVFTVAAVALLVIPGPAVLYITSRSIEQGRRAGMASVLGIHLGSLAHVAASTLGLSAILVTSAAAFTTVKLAGAAYLVAIGVRRLVRRVHVVDEAERPAPASLRRLFTQGAVINLLNPKTALFFFAFLPQFVDDDRGPVWTQVLVLGCTFILLGMCTDSAYAVAAGTVGERLRRSARFTAFQERWSGAVYVGLGLSAAFTRSPTRVTT